MNNRHIFSIPVLLAAMYAQQASAQTASETLDAINKIYSFQDSCRDSRLIPGSTMVGTDVIYDFSFGHDDKVISFKSIRSISAGSTHLVTQCLIRFNPADISSMYDTTDPDIPSRLMYFKCFPGIKCIYHGCSNTFVSEAFIPACDPSIEPRLAKAISFLRKFYVPSKKIPF